LSHILTIDDPAYFDRLAEIEERHWWSLGVWQLGAYWLEAALQGRRGLRALDVGCGTGMTAVRLARLRAIAEVVGIDPSLDALEHARHRHSFSLHCGSVLDLPFPDGRFDLASCFDVLQHLPVGTQPDALAEIARVLVPGGWLLLRSNGRGWSGDRLAYRLDDLVKLVTSAGFQVQRASHANCLPSLAQEVRGRIGSRKGASHPSGGGLQIAMPHPIWNTLLSAEIGCESFVAGRLGWRLPFGHSTMLLARRSGGLEGDRTAAFWSVTAPETRKGTSQDGA
jgi:SAM-dependent methyltransferase